MTSPISPELREALVALGFMYSQYCGPNFGPNFGHDFMSAGEQAIEVLEKYGLGNERKGVDEIALDKLERGTDIVTNSSEPPQGHLEPSSSPISDILREQLFWVARGTLQMAENIRLNAEENEINSTFSKLDEQYYHKKYGEDDGSYRIQEAYQAITALLEAAIGEDEPEPGVVDQPSVHIAKANRNALRAEIRQKLGISEKEA